MTLKTTTISKSKAAYQNKTKAEIKETTLIMKDKHDKSLTSLIMIKTIIIINQL